MGRTDYLVTGATGQLGRAVLELARARGFAAAGAGHAELPVEDQDAVRQWIGRHQPRWVVHCAAWTNVDGCEAEPERADRINGHAAAYVAESCLGVGSGLVLVSTDFVFDGRATSPYPVDAAVAPLSAYGRSKALGEAAVLRHEAPRFHVVRTSWVFGPGGRNFPRAILERARSGQPLRVVDDQVGSPTMTRDLAAAILDLCARDPAGGIWHAANAGQCSWHQFACEVLRAAGLGDVPVGATTSAELARPAVRPAYSVLDCSKLAALLGRPLPHYLDALRRYLEEEAS